MFGALWLEAMLASVPLTCFALSYASPGMFARRQTPGKAFFLLRSIIAENNMGNFNKSRQGTQEKKTKLFLDGHNTKGLEHKKGRNLGHFSYSLTITMVGLPWTHSQSQIHMMLLKSLGSSFALTLGPVTQEPRDTACVPKDQEEERKGACEFLEGSVW